MDWHNVLLQKRLQFRELRREFGIQRSSAHAIKNWVQNFKTTDSTLKKKGGSVKTACTPKTVAVVREAIGRCPHQSVRRHAISLGLSEASVRRILHKDRHL
jgi:hypothetical protein